MITNPSGNAHARHTDPATSKAASWADFTKLKQVCLLLFYQYDREVGLTFHELQMTFAHTNVQARFGKHPLGACPWHRITDCVNEGWIAPVMEPNWPGGPPITRVGDFGKRQQVWRITVEGRIAAGSLKYEIDRATATV